MEGRVLTVRAELADCAASNVNSRAIDYQSVKYILLDVNCPKSVSLVSSMLEILGTDSILWNVDPRLTADAREKDP